MKLLKNILVVLIVCLTLTETIGTSFSVIDAKAVTEETAGGGSGANAFTTTPFAVSDWKDTGKKTYVADGTFNGEQGYYLFEQVRTVGYYVTNGWLNYSDWRNKSTVKVNNVNTNKYTGDTLTETQIIDNRTLYKYWKQTVTKKTYFETIYHTQFKRNTGTRLRPKWQTCECTSKYDYPASSGRAGTWTCVKKWKTISSYTKDVISYEKTGYLLSQPANVGTTITYARTNDAGLEQVRIATRTYSYREKYEHQNVKRSAYQSIDFSKGPVLHVTYTCGEGAPIVVDTFYLKKGTLFGTLIDDIRNQVGASSESVIGLFNDALIDGAKMAAEKPEEVKDWLYRSLATVIDKEKAKQLTDLIEFDENHILKIDDFVITPDSIQIVVDLIQDARTLEEMCTALEKEGVTREKADIIVNSLADIAWRRIEPLIPSVAVYTYKIVGIIYKLCSDYSIDNLIKIYDSLEDGDTMKIDFYQYKYGGIAVFADIDNTEKFNSVTTKGLPSTDNYYSVVEYKEDTNCIEEVLADFEKIDDLFSVNKLIADIYKNIFASYWQ